MVGLIYNLMSLESSLLPLLLCSCLVIAAAVTLATLWLCLCYYYNFSRIPGPVDWFSSRLYKVEKHGQRSFVNSLRKKARPNMDISRRARKKNSKYFGEEWNNS